MENLMRCPKCGYEYQDRFEQVGHGMPFMSHRPFLLGCGHSICENCIFTQRQNTVCAVCKKPAPPTKNTTAAIKSKDQKYRVREFYDLNFHLLGLLHSNAYYRRFGSVNNSINISVKKEKIEMDVNIKCVECDQNNANVQCYQCDVDYCKRCFDTIHMRSKVLKTHRYVKLMNDKCIDNYIKIDNVPFKFPKKQYCKQHEKVRNLHCMKCQYIMCSACARQYHHKHKIYSLHELNKNYVSDILVLQDAVSTTYDQTKKNGEAIRNIDNVLEGYAIETLESISNYFIYMHGLLQNAEMSITESLRQKCLEPQRKLRHAINKNNGYEKILTKMRDSLSIYSMDIPTDIDFKNLVSLYNNHLNSIPNHMSLTEINANPFIFQTDENVIHKFENICHSKFDSPKLDIKYYFPSDSSLSLINQRTSANFLDSESINSLNQTCDQPNTINRNLNEQTFHIDQQKMLKPNKQNKNETVDNEKHASQDSKAKENMNLTTSVQSFISFEETITQTTGEPKSKIKMDVVKLPPKKLDWLKNNATVRFSNVETPDSFYLQSSINFLNISASLLEICNPKIPISIDIGNMYVLFNVLDKMWYRALVKDIKNKIYTVFLVDIGVNINVKIETNGSMLYEICAKDAEVPYAAIRCCLRNLLPADGKKWTDEAKLLMHQIAENYALSVKYIQEIGKNFYMVDLRGTNRPNKIYVRDAFLYSGLAQEVPSVYPFTDYPKTKLSCTVSKRNQIIKPILLPGDLMSAQMVHIESPGEFYVIEHTNIQKRDAFLHKLNEFFRCISDSDIELIFVGAVGMVCVVNIKTLWHRAIIQEICGSGYVRVHLVDHGREDTIRWSDIFSLPENLKQQQFTFRCSLVDVEPMQINGYTWTAETNLEFKQLTSNPNMQIEAISVEDDIYNVIVRMLKNNNKINIGAMLVHRHLACSTGIHSTTAIDHSIEQPFSSCFDEINVNPMITSMQYICHNATKSKGSNSAEAKKVKRIPVIVIHVVDPSEFYLRLTSMNAGLCIFEDRIQDICQKKVDSFVKKASKTNINWKENDHCLVHTNNGKLPNSKWYRGIVKAVTVEVQLTKKISLFSVFLRDYGITVESIHSGRLLPIDNELDQTANAVQRCNLAGLRAPGVLWSTSATEFFTNMLTESQSITATFVECNKYSISVILWGVQQDDNDPLAPSINIITNINQCIGCAGFAIYKHCETIKEDQLKNENELNHDFQSIKALINEIDLVIEKVDNNGIPNEKEYPINYGNDQYLDELIDANSTASVELPRSWLKQRSITKTIFTAKPSYVDFDANIYITLIGDLDFLNKMKAKFSEEYANVFKNNIHLKDFYSIDQPCVVIYHRDNCYYRGIVKKVNSDGTYEVFFVDYGNVETVCTAEMIPYAPLPGLHSMTTRIRIYGVKPINNERYYTTDVLDTIHILLVDKLVSVTVLSNDDILQSNEIPRCEIRVGSLDIRNFLIEHELAVDSELTCLKDQRIGLYEEQKKNFYIDSDGDVGIRNLLDETVNSVHIPQKTTPCSPKTKKPLYDWEDLKTFNENVSIENLPNNEGDNQDGSDNNINKKYFNTINDDLEMDEGNGIKEQLQQRLSYQLEDKADLSKFCPLDTSSMLSAFNGIGSIPPQQLPTGVTEFYCSIDSIISPTELQIYPRLTELQKRDLAMMRETAQLIKNMPNLSKYEPNMLCLACYGRDRKWYRAMIRSYSMSERCATVLYIDYLNVETLPLRKLRQMPNELLSWPLRSLRVMLHNITPNSSKREYEVRKAMSKCILEPLVLYARVVKNDRLNSNSNNDNDDNVSHACNLNCNGTTHSSPAYMEDVPRITTIELYEDAKALIPIYQKLIDKGMYITNKT